jgi:uncharacterized protein (DUF433 family)
MDQRESAAIAPITERELDEWEARARERGSWPSDDVIRLIAEVRRLRRRTKARRINRVPGKCGGAPTFAGTRMGVADVVALARRYDWDLERVRVQEFPDLSPADIEAAVEYFRQHEEEIEAILLRDRESREALSAAPKRR